MGQRVEAVGARFSYQERKEHDIAVSFKAMKTRLEELEIGVAEGEDRAHSFFESSECEHAHDNIAGRVAALRR